MSKFKVGDIVIFSHPDREAEGARTYWAKKICNLGFEYRVNNIHQDGSIYIHGGLNSYWCNTGQFTLKSECDMQNKTEKKLIPFDLERAKKGDIITGINTKSKGLLVATNKSQGEIDHLFQFTDEDGDQSIATFQEKGRKSGKWLSGFLGDEIAPDFFMAPMEKTGWIAIFKGLNFDKRLAMTTNIYASESDAIEAASHFYDYASLICTKQITWTE